MSRGFGRTQRFILENLPKRGEADSWVTLSTLANKFADQPTKSTYETLRKSARKLEAARQINMRTLPVGGRHVEIHLRRYEKAKLQPWEKALQEAEANLIENKLKQKKPWVAAEEAERKQVIAKARKRRKKQSQ